MPNPLISVVIPTYNRTELLPRAINSVLNQTYQNFEIIVIDDRSTDNTKKIIKKFKDKRINYFLNTHKKGPGGARNCGIKKSKGEYVAFLDDDDEWLPFHLKESLLFFKKFPETSIVFSDYRTIKNNKMTSKSYFNRKKQLYKIPAFTKNNLYRKLTTPILTYLIEENFIPTPTTVIKMKHLKNILFDEDIFNGEDWDFMLRLVNEESAGYINKIHCNVYLHDKNICALLKSPNRAINEHKKIWTKLLKLNLTKQNKKSILKNMSQVFFMIGYAYFLKNDFQKAKINYFESLKYKITYKPIKGLLIIYLLPYKLLVKHNKNRNE